MNFKEITNKILKGDFSGLFSFSRDKNNVDPADIAKVLASLPAETAMQAFQSFPIKNQMKIFPYLDLLTQKKIIRHLGKARASYILNNLRSDDRLTFFSSLNEDESSYFLSYLTEPNKDTTFHLLDYPDNSVARLIDTDFATINQDMTVAEACEHMRQHHKDTEAANDIYVVNDAGELIDD